jgi:hypothetical protein
VEACLGKTETTDLEVNPEEKQTVTEQQEVSKEETATKTVKSMEGVIWGTESSPTARQTAEETASGQWWVPEEIGSARRRMKRSYRTDGRAEKTGKADQGQCYKRNLERTDVR